MKTTIKSSCVAAFVICLIPALAFGQFQQTCAHNSSGDNCPDLIYDPADGSVTLDPDGLNQDPGEPADRARAINAFSIQHTNNPAWDFTANPLPDVTGLPAGGNFDFIAKQFGWVSGSTSVGFENVQQLGPIFPAGLDLAGLQGFLKDGSVSFGNDIVSNPFPNPPSGGGGGTLGMIIEGVIPEPSSFVILAMGLLSIVSLRRRS